MRSRQADIEIRFLPVDEFPASTGALGAAISPWYSGIFEREGDIYINDRYTWLEGKGKGGK